MAVEEHLSCKSTLATALFLWTSIRCPSFAVNHLKIVSVRSPYQLFLDVQNHAYHAVSYNKVLNLYFESEPSRIPAKPRLIYLQRLPVTRPLKGFFLRFKPAVWWTLINRYHAFAERRFFPRFSSTWRNMSAFKPFLQYFATGPDSDSCQDYESERTQIFDLFTRYRLQPHKLFSIHARNSKSPFEIILVSLHPSFSDKGTFSVRVREKTMETVDWRPRKLRFQQTEKKPLEGAC